MTALRRSKCPRQIMWIEHPFLGSRVEHRPVGAVGNANRGIAQIEAAGDETREPRLRLVTVGNQQDGPAQNEEPPELVSPPLSFPRAVSRHRRPIAGNPADPEGGKERTPLF